MPTRATDRSSGSISGAEAISHALDRNGVEVLFTVPGEQIDSLLVAVATHSQRIRVVQARHEQGAAYMACGYARASGRPGVYAVVSGPGFLNTTAALATAYAAGAPVLCLAGEIPREAAGKGLGLLHEIPDQAGVMQGLTKWSRVAGSSGEAGLAVEEAFARLRAGRPRPVAVAVPTDVLDESGVPRTGPAPSPPPAPEPDAGAVAAAAELLAEARRPLIFLGGGAADCPGEVREVAELLGAPVISAQAGRGILDARHPLAFGLAAGHRLWPRADALLAVGTRLTQPQLQWGLDGLAVVRVDVDPHEIHKLDSPEVALEADAGAALRALGPELAGRTPRSAWNGEPERVRGEIEVELAALRPQLEYVEAIRAALPDDGRFVDELTQVGYAARVALPVHRPRTYLSTTYQGTLGAGFPTALGAKLADPAAGVVSVCGDGGFLYAAQELATAVQHRIGVVTVVFDDGAYGNVRRSQLERFGLSVGCDLVNPDFLALARAFGAEAVAASGPGELTREIKRALERPLPTVIVVPVGEMPSPWHLIRLGRARPGGRS